jgi:hypothetical protein
LRTSKRSESIEQDLDNQLQKLKGEALSQRRLSDFLSLHTEAELHLAFRTIKERFDPQGEEYWSLVRQMWAMSESPSSGATDWQSIFQTRSKWYHLFMTPSEREYLANLPPVISVYRGCVLPEKIVFSWTLIISVAQKYSTAAYQRHRASPHIPRATKAVLKGETERENAFAYFNGKGEKEIIVLPKHVKNVEVLKPRKRRLRELPCILGNLDLKK